MAPASDAPNGISGPIPLIIDNQDVKTDQTFPITSPSTGKDLYQSYSASVEHAEQAAASCAAALPKWKATKVHERRDLLLRAADILEKRGDELADIVISETAAPEIFARFFQIGLTIDYIRDQAGRIAAAVTGEIPAVKTPGQNGLVFKEPYGVVLSIAPWNAPIILGARAIITPLAAGNTVVLKGSELCPRTFHFLTRIFIDAGLPAGALNLLYHRREDAIAVTNSLVANPSIRKINFTGSTATGSAIAAQAGKYLKPVLMELGGKAPAIVFADADLELAAREVTNGAMFNAGQVCMSTERVLVERSILPAFQEKLKAAVDGFAPESGPAPTLVATAGADKTRDLVRNAIKSGAKVVGGSADVDLDSGSARMRPIVVTDVDPKDKKGLWHMESFGPQVSIAAIDTEDEAVRMANDTDYGLSSAVFTSDLQKGLRVAKQIESGAVHINSMSIHDEPALAHGGWKASGFGRFAGGAGIGEFLQSKTITYMG